MNKTSIETCERPSSWYFFELCWLFITFFLLPDSLRWCFKNWILWKDFELFRFLFVYLEIDEKPDDHLSFADFLTVVHEYWIPLDDDKQQLQEAFDILDPENKSKMMVDEFVYLLKNCDWPEEDIDLILSQVNCSDGYFLHDGNNHYFHFFFFDVFWFLFRFTKTTLNTSWIIKEKIWQRKKERKMRFLSKINSSWWDFSFVILIDEFRQL